MKYPLIAMMIGWCALLGACHEEEFDDRITLNDITEAIVPTLNLSGDRDFDGNGPIMDIDVELTIERGGRAIFAHINFSAHEDGGDNSRTEIGPVNFLVWRWRPSDGLHFVHAINSPTRSSIRHRSAPGCGVPCATVGRVESEFEVEDGGLITTVVSETPGPVRDITLLGDTTGDDISTDDDPHGDTSIRRIRFNQIDVTMGSTPRPTESVNGSLSITNIPWINFCRRGDSVDGRISVSGTYPHPSPADGIPAILVVHEATSARTFGAIVAGGPAHTNFTLNNGDYSVTSHPFNTVLNGSCDGCVEYHMEARDPSESSSVDTRTRRACIPE